ncbi:DNA-directed DNA polymerase, partial [Tanacetum coccineum]
NLIRRIHFHRIRRIQLSVQYSVFIQLINTTYSLLLNTAYRSSDKLRMTKVIKGEFEKLKDVSLTCGTSLEVFNKEFNFEELRSPDFNLFYDQEYSEEEVAKTMAEAMEQYMSKTRADYGSGVSRPKIEDKDNFELKGQFLKELRTNTFSGSDHEDANEHIEKVLEIVDLFHIPNITIDQVMLRAFPMSLTGAVSRWLRNEPTSSVTTWDGLKTKFLNKYCPPARTAKKMKEINNFQQEPDENLYQAWRIPTRQILNSRDAIPSKTASDAKLYKHNSIILEEIKKVNEKVYAAQVGCEQCKGPHYTKDCPLKEEGKTLEEAYYTQFGGPFQGGGYRAAAPGFYQMNNVNPSYQERRQYMEDTLSKFMSELTKRHEEKSNLIKEIQTLMDAAIRNQGASIKTLEIQIGQISKVLQERGFGSLPSSTEANPRDQVKLISTTIEAEIIPDTQNWILPIRRAKLSVMPLSTYLNLGLGELAHTKLTVELANKTVKYPKGIAENVLVGIGKFVFPIDFIILDMPEDIKVPLIRGRLFFLIKRVYMLSLRERMELDSEARLIRETLVINRSLDPLNGDYIELNDLNEPFELRRNQDDDLMPTIEEGEVVHDKDSSTKELLLPFENPEQKFCSRRRLFDTPSLVESNSLKFDHNFDIEAHSIKQDTHFKLKGQFLKELRDNTFSSSEYEDANEHIEKPKQMAKEPVAGAEGGAGAGEPEAIRVRLDYNLGSS